MKTTRMIPLALAGVAAMALLLPTSAEADRRGHHSDRGQRGAWMMLETFDTNGDGEVTQAEIDAFRSGQIAEFDTDGDSTLTLEEYEALWLSVMRERMVDRFQGHDDDGDGIVTLEEFSEPYSSMVERRDRNGDGVLTADDLRRPNRAHRDRGPDND